MRNSKAALVELEKRGSHVLRVFTDPRRRNRGDDDGDGKGVTSGRCDMHGCEFMRALLSQDMIFGDDRGEKEHVKGGDDRWLLASGEDSVTHTLDLASEARQFGKMQHRIHDGRMGEKMSRTCWKPYDARSRGA